MLSPGDLAHDARVRGDLAGAVSKRVGVRTHELALVEGAAVAKDDLGRVFVWHEYGRAGQSAPMSIHAVGLKRLLDHADVKHGSHLESVGVHGGLLH